MEPVIVDDFMRGFHLQLMALAEIGIATAMVPSPVAPRWRRRQIKRRRRECMQRARALMREWDRINGKQRNQN